MAYYPVFLNLAGRRCAVIGGGSVGQRKVEGLVESGANVTVISPRLTERLDAFVKQGTVQHVSREYQTGDLAGFDLAFAATDDGALNMRVFEDAREKGIWINAADDPSRCDFILPAVIRRGELMVAVSTGGASPALTRAIREDLEKYFPQDFKELVEVASEVRRELRRQSVEVSASRWNEALKGDFRQLIKEGRAGEAKQLLVEKLGAKS
jgi:precorrin-2 dehydrogenase / sirohydrochlorin ferrochelatase